MLDGGGRVIGNVVTVSWGAQLSRSIYTVFTRTRNRARVVTRAVRGNRECENVCDQRGRGPGVPREKYSRELRNPGAG